MDEYRIVYTDHASDMMRERRISEKEVFHVVSHGIVIKEYPDDTPYPSVLLLCWCEKRPLHIVVAKDEENMVQFIVTAYEPDPHKWEEDFERRRR